MTALYREGIAFAYLHVIHLKFLRTTKEKEQRSNRMQCECIAVSRNLSLTFKFNAMTTNLELPWGSLACHAFFHLALIPSWIFTTLGVSVLDDYYLGKLPSWKVTILEIYYLANFHLG